MKNVNSWEELFQNLKKEEYYQKLEKFLLDEYKSQTIYPPRDLLFQAFKLTPLEKVKVVIVGQDPYHEEGQAMGLSFSVPKGIKVPPSLVNIYKEIAWEYNCQMDLSNGDLTYLAKQGVLLLNSILSVRAHQPLSHNIPLYKNLLKEILETLDEQNHPIVFLLWGGPARQLKKYLHNPSHLILECVHPSPLAAIHGGWFQNNHFLSTNEYLKNRGAAPIDWTCQK